jgi:hypothetical protein
MIYSVFLFLHSVLRWVVVLAGAYAVVRAIVGHTGRKPYEKPDNLARVAFVSGLHLNFIIGLLLYLALSPITSAAFQDMGAAMKVSALRFFTVEHPFGMVLAVGLATAGSARVRRSADDATKHRRALIFFGLAFLVLMASIPWPFYPAGRSLLFLGF